jgi:hypothetical protein
MGLVKEKTEKERRLQKQIKEIQNFFLEQHIPCSKEQAEEILKFDEMNYFNQIVFLFSQ